MFALEPYHRRTLAKLFLNAVVHTTQSDELEFAISVLPLLPTIHSFCGLRISYYIPAYTQIAFSFSFASRFCVPRISKVEQIDLFESSKNL